MREAKERFCQNVHPYTVTEPFVSAKPALPANYQFAPGENLEEVTQLYANDLCFGTRSVFEIPVTYQYTKFLYNIWRPYVKAVVNGPDYTEFGTVLTDAAVRFLKEDNVQCKPQETFARFIAIEALGTLFFTASRHPLIPSDYYDRLSDFVTGTRLQQDKENSDLRLLTSYPIRMISYKNICFVNIIY